MEATIDRFGRIVIPKTVRDHLGLEPGMSVTIEEVDGAVRVCLARERESLVMKEGVLVYAGAARGDVDAGLRQLRESRVHEVAARKRG